MNIYLNIQESRGSKYMNTPVGQTAYSLIHLTSFTLIVLLFNLFKNNFWMAFFYSYEHS